jgi:hypothetical protein
MFVNTVFCPNYVQEFGLCRFVPFLAAGRRRRRITRKRYEPGSLPILFLRGRSKEERNEVFDLTSCSFYSKLRARESMPTTKDFTMWDK